MSESEEPDPLEEDDPKYAALLQRITELEEENESLRNRESEGGSGRVPYRISGDLKKYISRSKTDQIQKLVQEKKITANDTLLVESGEWFIDEAMEEEVEMSLLEYAALYGEYEVCSLLINLGATADLEGLFEQVINKGHIHIALLLASMELTGGGGTEAEDISMRLSRQNGIIKGMLSSISEKDENIKIFIETIENNMVECIEKEVGFSDDYLNTLYFYYTKVLKTPFIETNLFGSIIKKCTQIINHKTTKNWYFFKNYIMASTIWFRDAKAVGFEDYFEDFEDEVAEEEAEIKDDTVYECKHELKPYVPKKAKERFCDSCEIGNEANETFYGCKECQYDRCHQCFVDKKDEPRILDGPPDAYLFYELLKIVQDGFEDKVNKKLQKPFRQIAEENADDWKALCSYDIESTLESRCRQDLVPNGVKPEYTHNELTKYVPSSSSFNAYSHYDINEYLSKLLLTAHTVDDDFHKSIQMIFQIDLNKNNESAIKELNNMEYQRGPLKLLSRCKAKAETDYVDEPFPSAACILDINRCALIFEDIGSMLKALNLFKDKVSYFLSGNIVAICRDKNGFKEYKHSKPDYADIKFNVLIKGVKNNVIGEVQFMLRAMMNFKHSVHSLYSIVRRKEFVDDFVKLLPLKNDPSVQLRSAASMVDYNAICDMMVTHRLTPQNLLYPVTETGTTILTSIFKNVHFKSKAKAAIRCFKVLLDNVPRTLLTQKLLRKDEDGSLGEDGVRSLGQYEMTKLLFKEIPEFEELMKEEEHLRNVCTAALALYPEPQQFINLTDILNVDKAVIHEWFHNVETFLIPLMARQEQNVKYIFSFFESKLEVMKFLNSPFDEEDPDITVILGVLGLGGEAVRTLLTGFDLKERLELISKANLVVMGLAMDNIDTVKIIIEMMDGADKEQYEVLTSEYSEVSLIQMAEQLGSPSTVKWIEHKIAKLEAALAKQ